MKTTLPDYVITILDILHTHDKEAFLVGGCVRDMLMDRVPHDYDIATNALPQEVITIFQTNNFQVIPTGMKHGTVSVFVEHVTIEITTYRYDLAYKNHRTPSQVVFSQILKEDLKRRDFTMNAIAFHPDVGIIDPFHGVSDINNRIIRCVGDPESRFHEDALRILRAIRFEATLHFNIEEDSKQAIYQCVQFLSYLSKERIRDEFNKLLLGDMENTLEKLRKYGILPYILPGYERIYDFHQANPWHLYDVFTHTSIALNHTKGYPLECKLAIIFHDLGKPAHEHVDEKGIAHYKNHALTSSKQAVNYMHMLNYDKKTIRRVHRLVLYHDSYVSEHKAKLRRYLTQFDNDFDFAVLGLYVQIADNMAKNKHWSQEKIDIIHRCIPILKEIAEKEILPSLKTLALNGYDIKNEGFQGNEIGIILRYALNHIIDYPQDNQKEILLAYIKKHAHLLV